jgi:hypothetical protein
VQGEESASIDRGDRRAIRLRAFLVPEGRRGEEVVLLDLSYEGCGIETGLQLAAGDKVELSVMSRGAIEAEVRWARKGKAGLVFAVQGPATGRYWPRRHDRTPIETWASMRRLGKLNYKVRVYDLSPSGCRVELVDKPRLDEKVMIKFEGLEAMHCEVCWVRGNFAGLNFERAMHPAVFDLLLDRLG